MYFTDGLEEISIAEDYTSHNTERLDIEGVKKLLLKLDFVQSGLESQNGLAR